MAKARILFDDQVVTRFERMLQGPLLKDAQRKNRYTTNQVIGALREALRSFDEVR